MSGVAMLASGRVAEKLMQNTNTTMHKFFICNYQSMANICTIAQ